MWIKRYEFTVDIIIVSFSIQRCIFFARIQFSSAHNVKIPLSNAIATMRDFSCVCVETEHVQCYTHSGITENSWERTMSFERFSAAIKCRTLQFSSSISVWNTIEMRMTHQNKQMFNEYLMWEHLKNFFLMVWIGFCSAVTVLVSLEFI